MDAHFLSANPMWFICMGPAECMKWSEMELTSSLFCCQLVEAAVLESCFLRDWRDVEQCWATSGSFLIWLLLSNNLLGYLNSNLHLDIKKWHRLWHKWVRLWKREFLAMFVRSSYEKIKSCSFNQTLNTLCSISFNITLRVCVMDNSQILPY